MNKPANSGSPRHAQRFLHVAASVLIAGLLLLAYYLLDPAASRLAPKCPVYAASGWLCPGCGSQRMLHSLLHGDLAAAWEFNAFLLLCIPLILLYTFSAATRCRFPRLYARLNSLPAIIAFSVAIIAWTILRNTLLSIS